jgi:hypothetical protein
MKNLLLIFFLFFCYNVVAQQRFPTGIPNQFSTGWFKQGYHQSDSGTIIANRDTNWLAKYSGTVVFKPSNKKFYWFDSTNMTWNQFGFLDTTSLSNRINLKLNISDTAAMLLPYLRKADTTNKWVNDIRRLPGSLNVEVFKNGSWATAYTDSVGSGGGAGTVTSVALSMPSAFTVTGSPITTNGTFNVTGAGLTTEYIRGNGTLATTDTGMIPNFHLKVRSLITGTSPITFNQTTGAIGINNATASGTKGAATFNNSDFSDNGSGTISLSSLVSAGSCTGCVLNINTKGIITGYSDGPGGATDNVNLGTGFRILNSATQEMRTIFAGFGTAIDSVANANGLTWSADTTRGAGLPSYFYVDSLFGLNTPVTLNNIGSGFRLLATPVGNFKTIFGSNTILIDSSTNANALTIKGDTSLLATQYDLSLLTGDNGITRSTNTFILGGTLNQNTTISTTSSYFINVTGSNTGQSLKGTNTSTGTGVMGQSTNGSGIYGLSSTLNGVLGVSVSGTGLVGESTSGEALNIYILPSSTNSLVPIGRGIRYTSGTAANGIGGSFDFYTQSTSGSAQRSNRIGSVLSNATTASRVSDLEFYGVNNAVEARKAKLAGSGQWTWDGYPALTPQIDTTTYKPVAVNMTTGEVVPFGGWPSSGGGGGGITGSGAANQLTFWTGASSVSGDAGLTMNATTNTIISDTNRLLRINVTGDSTLAHKFVFYPSKTKPGSISAAIGYGESNNEHDADSSVNNTFEGRIGGVDGASGAYIRWGMEKRWMPFPGAGYYQMESHPIEYRILDGRVFRPISWTGKEGGDDGTMLMRANLFQFTDWDGQRDLGGFSRAVGQFQAYHNYSGSGNVGMLVRDSTLASGNVIAAGVTITGQISGGTRLSTTQHYGQQMNVNFQSAPVHSATTSGANSFGRNYVFSIPTTNAGSIMWVGRGWDDTFEQGFEVANDGRTLFGAVNTTFFTGFRLQAVGANALIAATNNASTNTVDYMASFSHRLTAGGGANGIGAGFKFRADNASNTQTDIGSIEGVLTDVTASAEDGDVVIKTTRNAVSVEALRILSTGATTFNGAFTFPIAAAASPGMVLTDVLGDGIVTWESPSGGSQTWQQSLTTGSTLTGNNIITGANTNFTFDDLNTFRLNYDMFVQSKANATIPFTSVIGLTASNYWQFAHTPSAGSFTRGNAIVVDTLNNVGLGDNTQTAMPLYSTGNSTYISGGLQSRQGNFYSVTTKTTTGAVALTEYFILIDATGGSVTLTLPAASAAFGSGMGIQYVFKRIDNVLANTVTVARAGSDTIDGSTSMVLTTQYEVKELQCSSTSTWSIKN